MFDISDLILYGSTGICEVTDITTRTFDGRSGAESANAQYYVLKPVFQDGVIYAPLENPKVFMRGVASPEQVNTLIDRIPQMDTQAYEGSGQQDLKEHYQTKLRTYLCAEWMEIALSLYAKKSAVEEAKRKFGQVEERYMKQAERLLHEEFSVALGIGLDKVPAYIQSRVGSVAAM